MGVPVVDLTTVVHDLYEHADQVRAQRLALLAWAARYAESMAGRARLPGEPGRHPRGRQSWLAPVVRL